MAGRLKGCALKRREARLQVNALVEEAAHDEGRRQILPRHNGHARTQKYLLFTLAALDDESSLELMGFDHSLLLALFAASKRLR